ncbi:MAG: hypothetical protein U1A16_00150 [Patescibacteria group bacterium]|nr:hypothetical protein [Patescibacteria group bacterium]
MDGATLLRTIEQRGGGHLPGKRVTIAMVTRALRHLERRKLVERTTTQESKSGGRHVYSLATAAKEPVRRQLGEPQRKERYLSQTLRTLLYTYGGLLQRVYRAIGM